MKKSTDIVSRLITDEILIETKSGSLEIATVQSTGEMHIGGYKQPGIKSQIIIDPIDDEVKIRNLSVNTITAVEYIGLPGGGGGGGSPASPNNSVQFNNGGSFGGSSNLLFNSSTNVLSGLQATFTGITASLNGNATSVTNGVYTTTISSHATTAVAAGSGLTGGGTVGSLTLNVGAGDGITVNADDIAVNSTVVRTTGNQTLGGAKAFSSYITGSITGSDAKFITITGSLAGNASTVTNGIYTTTISSHATTAVAAGTGLTGGGTVGSLTLNVGAGDGITVNADDIAVNSTVIRTTGNQTLGGAKTFSSYITGSITGSDAKFTTITGSFVSGSTARFTTITGSFVSGTTAQFTTITGSFVSGSTARFTTITGSFVSGTTAQFTTITGSFMSGSTARFTTLTGSFSGSGTNITNITSSNISNFTNDVRNQFSAGTNVTIVAGVISSTGGGGGGTPGGINTSVQFNSGSTFSGSTQLVYNYTNNILSGTTAQFTNVTASNVLIYGTASLFSSPQTAYILYDSASDKLSVFPGLSVTGSITASGPTQLTTVSGTTAQFTTITGSFVSGSTARFTTITGSLVSGSTARFTTITGSTFLAAPGTNVLPSYTFLQNTGSGMFLSGSNVVGIAASTSLLFNVNGSERARVNSTGKVGLGTTNPLSKLHIKYEDDPDNHIRLESGAKNINIAMSGSTTDFDTGLINITSPDSSKLLTLQMNIQGERVCSITRDGVNDTTDLILQNNDPLKPDEGPSIVLSSSNSQIFKMRVDGDGLRLYSTSPSTTILRIDQTGNIDMNSGQGIDFGLTGQAPGMASELFDDYEEGTWTPAFSGSTGGGSFNYSNNEGTYTKIGNMVYISANVDISTVSVSGSGNVRITGIPFNVANTDGNQFHINIAWQGLTLSTNKILGFAADAGSWIDVFRTTGAVTNSLSTAMTMAELGTGGFRLSGFYRVA